VRTVVAAVIERKDRRILIGQRRKTDSSPLKWEFPGGKMEEGETAEAALARELREELRATLSKCVELGRVQQKYADRNELFEIRFFAVALENYEVQPIAFEQIAWVFPKELGEYDFLAANKQIIARLATGNIKPAEILDES
jgi:8-oxo-dGTP diphosphatase